MPAGAPGLQGSKDVGSLRSVQLGTNSQYRPESSVCLRMSPTNSSFRRVSSSSFHEGWAFIRVPHLFPSLLQMQVINCTLYFLGFHLLSLLVFFLQPTPSNIKLVTMFPQRSNLLIYVPFFALNQRAHCFIQIHLCSAMQLNAFYRLVGERMLQKKRHFP